MAYDDDDNSLRAAASAGLGSEDGAAAPARRKRTAPKGASVMTADLGDAMGAGTEAAPADQGQGQGQGSSAQPHRRLRSSHQQHEQQQQRKKKARGAGAADRRVTAGVGTPREEEALFASLGGEEKLQRVRFLAKECARLREERGIWQEKALALAVQAALSLDAMRKAHDLAAAAKMEVEKLRNGDDDEEEEEAEDEDDAATATSSSAAASSGKVTRSKSKGKAATPVVKKKAAVAATTNKAKAPSAAEAVDLAAFSPFLFFPSPTPSPPPSAKPSRRKRSRRAMEESDQEAQEQQQQQEAEEEDEERKAEASMMVVAEEADDGKQEGEEMKGAAAAALAAGEKEGAKTEGGMAVADAAVKAELNEAAEQAAVDAQRAVAATSSTFTLADDNACSGFDTAPFGGGTDGWAPPAGDFIDGLLAGGATKTNSLLAPPPGPPGQNPPSEWSLEDKADQFDGASSFFLVLSGGSGQAQAHGRGLLPPMDDVEEENA